MTQQGGEISQNDPAFKELICTSYKELKDGHVSVKFREKILKCPYCPDSREYTYTDLCSHVTRIIKESKSSSLKDKAKHMGLEEFLHRDFDPKVNDSKPTTETKATDLHEMNDDMSRHKNRELEELVVWPWMVVVANIPVQYKYFRYTGDSAKKLKDEWTKQGYKPTEVHPLWNWRGHSGFAIVKFGKKGSGFGDAMKFVKNFEVRKHGRKDRYDGRMGKDDDLYAWIARDKDYKSNGLVGDYLKKHGDLKTIAEKQKEDQVKDSKLVMGLEKMLEEKNKKSKEIESEISRTDHHMASVMRQKDQIEDYNRVNEKLQRISIEHEQTKMQLEEHDRMLKLADDQKVAYRKKNFTENHRASKEDR